MRGFKGEWERLFCTRLMGVAGWTKEQALEACEAWQASYPDEWEEDDPEDCADEELSNWG